MGGSEILENELEGKSRERNDRAQAFIRINESEHSAESIGIYLHVYTASQITDYTCKSTHCVLVLLMEMLLDV